MPILEVEIVLRPGESLPDSLAGRIADRAAPIFGGRSGTTWVRLHALAARDYAEDGAPEGGGPHPVFIRVLKAEVPPPEELESEMKALTSAVAEVCDRPRENVHIVYEPAGAGRATFGGRLVGS